MKELKAKLKAAGWLSFLLPLFFAGLVCFSAQAKSPVSLRISPLGYDLKIDPGNEQTGKIYIENTSEEYVAVSAEFSDFFVDDAGNYIFSDDKEIRNEKLRPYLMKEWISLSESDFALKKGGYKVLEYKIKVPSDATRGGHYGTIFLRTSCSLEKDEAVVSTDKSSLCVSGRVGTMFLVQVGGDAQKKGEIKSLNIPRISWEDKSTLGVEIENIGNTHFKPEGNIEMRNIWGQKISDFPIGDKTVLPTTSVKFEADVKREDLFGFYRISGNIKDGDGNTMTFKRFLFMPPWKEAVIAILVIFALFWGYKNLIIRRKKAKKT
jgi:hypothetical protein